MTTRSYRLWHRRQQTIQQPENVLVGPTNSTRWITTIFRIIYGAARVGWATTKRASSHLRPCQLRLDRRRHQRPHRPVPIVTIIMTTMMMRHRCDRFRSTADKRNKHRSTTENTAAIRCSWVVRASCRRVFVVERTRSFFLVAVVPRIQRPSRAIVKQRSCPKPTTSWLLSPPIFRTPLQPPLRLILS